MASKERSERKFTNVGYIQSFSSGNSRPLFLAVRVKSANLRHSCERFNRLSSISKT